MLNSWCIQTNGLRHRLHESTLVNRPRVEVATHRNQVGPDLHLRQSLSSPKQAKWAPASFWPILRGRARRREVIMSSESESATKFLNVDLDIHCNSCLQELLLSFGPSIFVVNRTANLASLELDDNNSVEETTTDLVNIIQSLNPEAKATDAKRADSISVFKLALSHAKHILFYRARQCWPAPPRTTARGRDFVFILRAKRIRRPPRSRAECIHL
jgi:hypothetical protein